LFGGHDLGPREETVAFLFSIEGQSAKMNAGFLEKIDLAHAECGSRFKTETLGTPATALNNSGKERKPPQATGEPNGTGKKHW
jgi:hypothetical protein